MGKGDAGKAGSGDGTAGPRLDAVKPERKIALRVLRHHAEHFCIFRRTEEPAAPLIQSAAPCKLRRGGAECGTVFEEIAEQTKYYDKVKKMKCFLGIKTHTALSLIVETGEFERFAKGNQYASYLGLAPGENSSSDSIHRLGITKAGNSHLIQLLIEASSGICKGAVGHKSKELRARQNGNTAEVIAYADKANTRLRSRYYKFIRHGKKRNVAVAAIARELACFVLGMMTDNIEMKAA